MLRLRVSRKIGLVKEHLLRYIKRINKAKTDKVVYIHIGPHKTGTTTIQLSLTVNESLLRKEGVLCPLTGRQNLNSAGQHYLAWELLDRNSKRLEPNHNYWENLLKEIRKSKNVDKVIISSEDFSSYNNSDIYKIRNLLSGYKVKIIIYLRRQDEALQSLWVAQVRNANIQPPVDSFIDWLSKFNYEAGSVNYLKIIQAWERTFSRENIILGVFDPKQFNGSLFNDFLALCELDIKNIKDIPDANVSPGPKTIEAMRMVKNSLDFLSIQMSHWQLITRYIKEFGDISGWNNSKVNYLDKELSDLIMQHHKEANDLLSNKYIQKRFLFPYDRSKEKPVDLFFYSQFTNQEIIDIYSNIIYRLSQDLSV